MSLETKKMQNPSLTDGKDKNQWNFVLWVCSTFSFNSECMFKSLHFERIVLFSKNARIEVHWFYGSCQVPFFLAVSFSYLTFPKIVALFYQETIKKGCIWKWIDSTFGDMYNQVLTNRNLLNFALKTFVRLSICSHGTTGGDASPDSFLQFQS